MKKLIKILFASVVILYGLPLIAIYFLQRSFMYFPPNVYLSPDEVGLDAIEIDISNGETASATNWWIPPKDAKPVIMYFHGNGSAVYSNHDIYKDLSAQGYGLLAVGYVGYPSRDGILGKPTQKIIVDAAIDQYDWLTEEGISAQRIIFYGTSLGSGIAAQVATKRKPAKIILEAPFNSTLDIGRKSMPVFPVQFLMKDTYRSDRALAGLDIPLVWMHGTADTVIPISQGQKLYDSYHGPKTHKIFDGGQHTNLWALGGREFVLAALETP